MAGVTVAPIELEVDGIPATLPELSVVLPDGRTGYYQRSRVDCLRAAVATATGIPYDEVGPVSTLRELQAWAEDRGYRVQLHLEPPHSERWIGCSPRYEGGLRHTLVMACDRVYHDPAAGRAGISEDKDDEQDDDEDRCSDADVHAPPFPRLRARCPPRTPRQTFGAGMSALDERWADVDPETLAGAALTALEGRVEALPPVEGDPFAPNATSAQPRIAIMRARERVRLSRRPGTRARAQIASTNCRAPGTQLGTHTPLSRLLAGLPTHW